MGEENIEEDEMGGNRRDDDDNDLDPINDGNGGDDDDNHLDPGNDRNDLVQSEQYVPLFASKLSISRYFPYVSSI